MSLLTLLSMQTRGAFRSLLAFLYRHPDRQMNLNWLLNTFLQGRLMRRDLFRGRWHYRRTEKRPLLMQTCFLREFNSNGIKIPVGLILSLPLYSQCRIVHGKLRFEMQQRCMLDRDVMGMHLGMQL